MTDAIIAAMISGSFLILGSLIGIIWKNLTSRVSALEEKHDGINDLIDKKLNRQFDDLKEIINHKIDNQDEKTKKLFSELKDQISSNSRKDEMRDSKIERMNETLNSISNNMAAVSKLVDLLVNNKITIHHEGK